MLSCCYLQVNPRCLGGTLKKSTQTPGVAGRPLRAETKSRFSSPENQTVQYLAFGSASPEGRGSLPVSPGLWNAKPQAVTCCGFKLCPGSEEQSELSST